MRGGAAARDDGCTERILALPTKYLLSLDVTSRGIIYVGHLRGLSMSSDGGRTFETAVMVHGAVRRGFEQLALREGPRDGTPADLTERRRPALPDAL